MTDKPQHGADAPRESANDRVESMVAAFNERRGYYIGLTLAAVAVVVATLVFVNRDETAKDNFSPVWDAYTGVRTNVRADRSSAEDLARLDAALDKVRGTDAEASALWLSAIAHYGAAFTRDKPSFDEKRPHLEQAEARLKELEDQRFDHFLPAIARWYTSSGAPPVKQLLNRVDDDLSWAKENGYERPMPDKAPTAVLRTDLGDIYLRFYAALAPKHVENFLGLAKKGAYNGTAFHFVRGGIEPTGVAGGDPLSYFYNDPLNKDQILRWGTGTTGYGIPPAESRFRLVHERAIVTAQRRRQADWDNGSQFQILLAADPSLDRDYSPFAYVVEGMDVVEKFTKRRRASEHGPYKDDPRFGGPDKDGLLVEPVWIRKVIVYGEDGRAFEHGFPLRDGEKSLDGLKSTPVKALSETDLRVGRTLHDPKKLAKFRAGIDIPFPDDMATLADASPEGERRVLGDIDVEGSKPRDKKEDEKEGESDGGAKEEEEKPGK